MADTNTFACRPGNARAKVAELFVNLTEAANSYGGSIISVLFYLIKRRRKLTVYYDEVSSVDSFWLPLHNIW